jgi:hypothetical protein
LGEPNPALMLTRHPNIRHDCIRPDGESESVAPSVYIFPLPDEERDSAKGRWGIELTTPLIEKLSLWVLYPPRRHGSFHLLKDDGVGLTVMTTMAVGSKPLDLNREKISLQDLYPPPDEERDSGERTMGVGSMMPT